MAIMANGKSSYNVFQQYDYVELDKIPYLCEYNANLCGFNKYCLCMHTA